MQAPRTPDPAQIRSAFLAERRSRGLRHRDAAAAIGVSEGEAIASLAGDGAIRLKSDFPALVAALEPLGEVMALTRNDSTVHERVGVYRGASRDGHVGLVLGDDIDLRIFYSRWKHAFAVAEDTPRGPQRSLQVFDATGTAVHKVFLKPQSNLAEYLALIEAWSDDDQTPGIATVPAAAPMAPRDDSAIDVAGLRAAWGAMQDTHEFFGLLRNFGVARTQALRLAGDSFAERVPAAACRQMLEAAAAAGTPIMCFVGNPGVIQIHTGPVVNVRMVDEWINVLDERFNLHLRGDHIAEAWVVRKPTSEGIVTSLELFDAAGETMAMFFGKRKPGIPELQAWRDIVAALPRA